MQRIVVDGPLAVRLIGDRVLVADRPIAVELSPEFGVCVRACAYSGTLTHEFTGAPLALLTVEANDSAVVELSAGALGLSLVARAAYDSRIELPVGVRLFKLVAEARHDSHVVCATRAFARHLVARLEDSSTLTGVSVAMSATVAAERPTSARLDVNAATRIHGAMILESITARPISPLPPRFFTGPCVACRSAESSIASAACGHCILCTDCATEANVAHLAEVCPLCRASMARGVCTTLSQSSEDVSVVS